MSNSLPPPLHNPTHNGQLPASMTPYTRYRASPFPHKSRLPSWATKARPKSTTPTTPPNLTGLPYTNSMPYSYKECEPSNTCPNPSPELASRPPSTNLASTSHLFGRTIAPQPVPPSAASSMTMESWAGRPGTPSHKPPQPTDSGP